MPSLIYSAEGARLLGPCVLREGLNTVPDDVWRKYASAWEVQAMLADGRLALIEQDPTPAPAVETVAPVVEAPVENHKRSKRK